MKKYVLPITLSAIFLYPLSNWLGVVSSEAVVYNLLARKLLCITC